MKLNFQNTNISFTDVGAGKVVVLLHGYVESKEVWGKFAAELSKKFRIISIDLLGHGESGNTNSVQTMDSMAEAVHFLLDFLKIDKCFLIGHSMGGYVALAFLEKFAKRLLGFSLFHASPLADTDEKKEKRNQEIMLIKMGEKNRVCRLHTPKTFAIFNLEKFATEIEIFQNISLNTPAESIIASLEGMKIRPNRSELLAKTELPFLYIIGMHDNFVPFNILEKIKLPFIRKF